MLNPFNISKEQNLPLLYINNCFIKESAKYYIQGYLGNISTYHNFIKISKKLYKGCKCLLAVHNGIIGDDFAFTVGTVQ